MHHLRAPVLNQSLKIGRFPRIEVFFARRKRIGLVKICTERRGENDNVRVSERHCLGKVDISYVVESKVEANGHYALSHNLPPLHPLVRLLALNTQRRQLIALSAQNLKTIAMEGEALAGVGDGLGFVDD